MENPGLFCVWKPMSGFCYPENPLTIGSCFSGIGGIELGAIEGLKRSGISAVVSWQIEIDPFCRRILKRHFPESKQYEDITEIKTEDLAKVDIIVGGFPCQDISVAGAGAGKTKMES